MAKLTIYAHGWIILPDPLKKTAFRVIWAPEDAQEKFAQYKRYSIEHELLSKRDLRRLVRLNTSIIKIAITLPEKVRDAMIDARNSWPDRKGEYYYNELVMMAHGWTPIYTKRKRKSTLRPIWDPEASPYYFEALREAADKAGYLSKHQSLALFRLRAELHSGVPRV